MAACRRCGEQLPGRRQKCDACRAATAKGPTQAAEPTEEFPSEVTTPVPAGLHARGRALWSTFGLEPGTPAGELALEVCRAADRLDELDRIVAGKGVLQLMRFRLDPDWWDDEGDRHVHVKVSFQSVLSEARGQQANFAALVAGLRAAIAEQGEKPGGTGPTRPAPVSALDQLAARRAEREQASR